MQALTLAPAPRSNLTMASWPAEAAMISGVHRLSSLGSGWQFLSINQFTISVRPPEQAQWRIFRPLSSVWFNLLKIKRYNMTLCCRYTLCFVQKLRHSFAPRSKTKIRVRSSNWTGKSLPSSGCGCMSPLVSVASSSLSTQCGTGSWPNKSPRWETRSTWALAIRRRTCSQHWTRRPKRLLQDD